MKYKQLKQITFTAVFSAMAYILTFFFKFKVGFLTFDFKDAIIAIIALVVGPLYALISVVVVSFLEFISVSDTGFYGLVMNIISSGTFALVIGGIYKAKRSFAGAIISAITASLSVVIIMMFANYFITPFYMGVSKSDVLNLIPTLLLPFNLAKTIMNSATTLIIYKPVTNAFKRIGLLEKNDNSKYKYSKKSYILLAVSILILIATTVFVINYLKGGFSIIR